jgi:hypothetical protein
VQPQASFFAITAAGAFCKLRQNLIQLQLQKGFMI